MKDLLGREIKVGDFLAASTVRYRSPSMVLSKVIEIKDDGVQVVKADCNLSIGQKFTYKKHFQQRLVIIDPSEELKENFKNV